MGIIGLIAIRNLGGDKKITPTQTKNTTGQLETDRNIIEDKESNSESEPSEASASFCVASESKPPPSRIPIQKDDSKSLSVLSKSKSSSLNSSIQNKEEKHSHDSMQNKSNEPDTPPPANDDPQIITTTTSLKTKSSINNTPAETEETNPENSEKLRGSGRASRYIKPPETKVQTVKEALKSLNFWLLLYMLTISLGN